MQQVTDVSRAADRPAEPGRPTWDQLVSACPALARFETEASEAAQADFADWLGWVCHYHYFKMTVQAAADATRTGFDDATAVVMDRLRVVYDRAAKKARR